LLITKESKIRNQILLTIEIASKCGQAIALNEIDLLLNQPTQKTIQEIVQNDLQIKKTVSIEKNYAVIKGYESLFQKREKREKTSRIFKEIAKTFTNQIIKKNPNWKLIAISGSVSYGSAIPTDDIDLFLVTQNNQMWQSFLKALLLARVFYIKTKLNGKKANLCLSYVQDEKNLEDEITYRKTPLLARELLSIQVLFGKKYYKSLLAKATWISEIFPNLYKQKMLTMETKSKNISPQDKNGIINLFIYVTLKKYLLLKALLKNLKYKKQNKNIHIFKAKITKRACVYISKRYENLEKSYKSIFSR